MYKTTAELLELKSLDVQDKRNEWGRMKNEARNIHFFPVKDMAFFRNPGVKIFCCSSGKWPEVVIMVIVNFWELCCKGIILPCTGDYHEVRWSLVVTVAILYLDMCTQRRTSEYGLSFFKGKEDKVRV